MSYKWNEVKEFTRYWEDDGTHYGKEIVKNLSDKEVINNFNQLKFEDCLRSLCHIVSELIEIEEKRGE